MLLCLLTGQRCQTIHSINIDYIQDIQNGCRIVIQEKLKQTRVGKHLEPIVLIRYNEDPQLCVIRHLQEYINRTSGLRTGNKQLFLSFTKPHKPVSKETISRWVKTVLKGAGIDTTKYSAHSSRASSTSFCESKGLNLQEIMKAAGWSRAGTFAKYYQKETDSTELNFGNFLLKETYRC